MKQHYRAKDFPLDQPRSNFTTIADFMSAVVDVPHVLIDRLTYACLANEFETVQDHVRLASSRARQCGFLCYLGPALIFTDAFLAPEQRWINQEPWDDNGRPQYIKVAVPKPFIPFTEVCTHDNPGIQIHR
jgi:hypothetical protein